MHVDWIDLESERFFKGFIDFGLKFFLIMLIGFYHKLTKVQDPALRVFAIVLGERNDYQRRSYLNINNLESFILCYHYYLLLCDFLCPLYLIPGNLFKSFILSVNVKEIGQSMYSDWVINDPKRINFHLYITIFRSSNRLIFIQNMQKVLFSAWLFGFLFVPVKLILGNYLN